MSCVALSSTNCNLGKLMRITSPLTIHGLCFHQRSFVVCAPLPKKKRKKNHVFCHFGVLFQILIFCFSHKDYPRHYSGDFAHAIVTIIGKHPNKGLAGFW